MCTSQSREALDCVLHGLEMHSILAMHNIKLPDDVSLVIRNMLEEF